MEGDKSNLSNVFPTKRKKNQCFSPPQQQPLFNNTCDDHALTTTVGIELLTTWFRVDYFRYDISFTENIKGVLNPNFRPFSFELRKN